MTCSDIPLQKSYLTRLLLAFLLLISFLPASLLSNPASVEEEDIVNVYQTILPEKSLLTSPQFLVVDDFNSGKFVNRRGAPWRTKAPLEGALDLSLDKQDGRNPDRGYSLKAQFNLVAKEEASFESFLNLIDVSKSDYLVFRQRMILQNQKDFNGRIRVELTDWKHKTVVSDITKVLPKELGEWGDVVIPMTDFRGLDLDQLFYIRISILAKDQNLRGDLWVDEMAFFGFNDVAFESHRDNLVNFPEVVNKPHRREELRKEKNKKQFLRAIAKDTWKYFEEAIDRDTQLVVDHIRLGDAPLAADYTSPTNIAMQILSTITAMDLEFISEKEASASLSKVLDSLEKMKKFKGFFYNFYDTKKLSVTREYISSVDSGWLGIALVILRQTFPKELGPRATTLIEGNSFEEFLDPENNQMVIGFDVPPRNFGGYHYGMLVTEARAMSLYAIGKGDVSEDHWWFLYRTPPKEWKWQNQVPKGKMVYADQLDYFQGYYEYQGKKFVPSWGGSMFEFLMPTLVLDEQRFARKGLGKNDKIVAKLHRDYALHEKGYPVWGISPAAVSSGRRWSYREFGVKHLGAKGYLDEQVITPHASFLALEFIPKDAILNIRKLLDYELYGEYGFYDSLRLRTNEANPQYLALDQGMILVSLGNYLTKGKIRQRYHQDPIGKKAEKFLMKESFFSH